MPVESKVGYRFTVHCSMWFCTTSLAVGHTGNRFSAQSSARNYARMFFGAQFQAKNLLNSDQTILPACANNMNMGIRQCLECGGELVMAFRPSEIGRLIPGTEKVAKSNATWRCSTCGQAFT